MRSITFFALFLVMSFAAGAYAQDAGSYQAEFSAVGVNTTAVKTYDSADLQVTFVDRFNCPLKLSLDSKRLRGEALGFRLQNTGDKLIRGYVLVIDDGRGQQTQTTVRPVKMIGNESIAFESTGLIKTQQLTFSVDYVEFADGSSWGADEFGRSKYIAAYLEGRNLAVSRLKEMTGGEIPSDLEKLLDNFGSFTTGEPAGVDISERANWHVLNGYRSVISLLQKVDQNSQESRDFAQRLQSMEDVID